MTEEQPTPPFADEEKQEQAAAAEPDATELSAEELEERISPATLSDITITKTWGSASPG